MSQIPKITARHVLGRAYRGVGKVGRITLGDEFASASGTGPARPDPDNPPWLPMPDLHELPGLFCNVCRWKGEAFVGGTHAEYALCPHCGSNARDRFNFWCFTERAQVHNALRIIECSPRLGADYRAAMASWFFYRTSDYDLRAHEGNLQLDLQSIDLPDGSVDVVMCAHVLEHVPDTDKALGELRRVVAPGGHLLLQVPVLQARTAPPDGPEFHGDHTPVFWRFGFDLTERLRDIGFTTSLLCTAELVDAVTAGSNPWPTWSGEFDVPDILAGAIESDLEVVADHRQAEALGVVPAYMFLTRDCQVPA
jgi:SAM-dependent methyltransferase